MTEKDQEKKRVEALIKKLTHEFDEKVCEEAASELAKLEGLAIPALVELLSDKNPDFVRKYVAQILKEIAMKNPAVVLQSVSALIKVLEDEYLVSAPPHLAHLIYRAQEALNHIAQKTGYKNY